MADPSSEVEVLARRPREPRTSRRLRGLVLALALASLGSVLVLSGAAAATVPARPGVGTLTVGTPVLRTPTAGSDAYVGDPSLSGDGNVIAFQSTAPLRPHDRSEGVDVFVTGRSGDFWRPYRARDVETGPDTDGATCPTVSRDGRYVVFTSTSGRLVPGDTNAASDVFRADRATGHVDLVSVGLGSTPANGPSGHSLTCLGSGGVSADGRFVAFSSIATNLVPGDTNASWDVFVRDLATHTTERVSVDSAGHQAHNDSGNGLLEVIALSGDGRYVVFPSRAANLVPGDTNRLQDLFLHDRLTHTTERVSLTDADGQIDPLPGLGSPGASSPSVSDDGRYVAFDSESDGIDLRYPVDGRSDVFLRDRLAGTTTQLSARNGVSSGSQDVFGYGSFGSSMSADGSVVAFTTTSKVLRAPGEPRTTPYVVLSSTATHRTFALPGRTFDAVLSADGSTVAFIRSHSASTDGVYGEALYTATLTWAHR